MTSPWMRCGGLALCAVLAAGCASAVDHVHDRSADDVKGADDLVSVDLPKAAHPMADGSARAAEPVRKIARTCGRHTVKLGRSRGRIRLPGRDVRTTVTIKVRPRQHRRFCVQIRHRRPGPKRVPCSTRFYTEVWGSYGLIYSGGDGHGRHRWAVRVRQQPTEVFTLTQARGRSDRQVTRPDRIWTRTVPIGARTVAAPVRVPGAVERVGAAIGGNR